MESLARNLPARPSYGFVVALAAVAVMAIPAAALMAQTPATPFAIAESGQSFATLQQAVDAIGEGRGTVSIAPGTYRQCAVQRAGEVTYLAAQPGTVTFERETCQGKAALVLGGRAARVAGIAFRGMAVPDGNGAGIRLEGGDLTIAQSWFLDSQQGILTGDNPNGTIVIDKTTFSGLGTCENSAGCAHSIYAGDYGTVTVTRSRFEQGTGGHYLKSRASRTVVEDSSFDDSQGRATNYLIDLPNGGTGSIRGNWFVQGRDKENWSTMIAVGAEGANYSSNGLVIAGNEARLVPGLSRNPAFVADWTGDDIVMRDNQLGSGIRAFEKR